MPACQLPAHQLLACLLPVEQQVGARGGWVVVGGGRRLWCVVGGWWLPAGGSAPWKMQEKSSSCPFSICGPFCNRTQHPPAESPAALMRALAS